MNRRGILTPDGVIAVPDILVFRKAGHHGWVSQTTNEPVLIERENRPPYQAHVYQCLACGAKATRRELSRTACVPKSERPARRAEFLKRLLGVNDLKPLIRQAAKTSSQALAAGPSAAA